MELCNQKSGYSCDTIGSVTLEMITTPMVRICCISPHDYAITTVAWTCHFSSTLHSTAGFLKAQQLTGLQNFHKIWQAYTLIQWCATSTEELSLSVADSIGWRCTAPIYELYKSISLWLYAWKGKQRCKMCNSTFKELEWMKNLYCSASEPADFLNQVPH